MVDDVAAASDTSYVSTGRRPRMPERRRSAVLVRVTVEEKAWLRGKAVTAGWSVPRLMMESVKAVATDESVATRKTLADELVAIRRLLANSANNMNQIAVKVNATGAVDCVQLDSALALFRRLGGRIADAVDEMI